MIQGEAIIEVTVKYDRIKTITDKLKLLQKMKRSLWEVAPVEQLAGSVQIKRIKIK